MPKLYHYKFTDGTRTCTQAEAIEAFLRGDRVMVGYVTKKDGGAWWNLNQFRRDLPNCDTLKRTEETFRLLLKASRKTCLKHTVIRYAIEDPEHAYTIVDKNDNLHTVWRDTPPVVVKWLLTCGSLGFAGQTREDAETALIKEIEARTPYRGYAMIAKHMGVGVYVLDESGDRYPMNGGIKQGQFIFPEGAC